MTTTRPYIVTDTSTGQQRLVQAATAAQARHHVTASRFTVKAASASEAINAVTTGIKPEVAGQEPQAQHADGDNEAGQD